MSTPQGLELERDSALDDDFGLHRALRIVKAFNKIYGKDPTTAQYLDELTDILIKVKRRASARHQSIEARRLAEQAERDEVAIQAQMM